MIPDNREFVVTDTVLETLVNKVVEARREYQRLYAIQEEQKAVLQVAIDASNDADDALQEYIDALAEKSA